MGRHIDANSLICSLGHCECDGHIVHKLSQRRLTVDWLAPRERDCSWMRIKVSSDRLPSYIKVTWSVLEIFKMAGYFPDRTRILARRKIEQQLHFKNLLLSKVKFIRYIQNKCLKYSGNVQTFKPTWPLLEPLLKRTWVHNFILWSNTQLIIIKLRSYLQTWLATGEDDDGKSHCSLS